MPNPVNQFYYAHGGRPILKTEYDDGTSDFYDASGQFPGVTWTGFQDGTVFDPYSSIAQNEADQQMAGAYAQAEADRQAGTGNRTIYGDPSGNNRVNDFGNQFGSAGTVHTQPVNNPGGGARPVTSPLNPGNRQQPGQPQPPAQPQIPQNPAQAPSTPGGQASTDPNQLTQMERYDWAGNPQLAMMNVFRDLGWQTVNNPYVDRLMQAAPGLAVSFMGQRGMGNAGPNAEAGSYSDYQRFLSQAIQSGSIFQTLNQGQSMWPGIIDAVRGYNQRSAAGGNAGAQLQDNPFMRVLSGLLSQGTGQNAMSMYGSLFSPFQTSAMQRSYQGLLQNALLTGQRGYQETGDRAHPGYGGNDWWKYLFGL